MEELFAYIFGIYNKFGGNNPSILKFIYSEKATKFCEISTNYLTGSTYSVSHNFIYPSKELCSKMALGEVGVSLP